eukprot:gene26652-biopygen17076
MSRGGCSRPKSSWNRSCRSHAKRGIGIVKRSARDRQLRFQLDSGREHPPRDM